MTPETCPQCGGRVVYVGTIHVECDGPDCPNRCPNAPQVKPVPPNTGMTPAKSWAALWNAAASPKVTP